MVGGGGFRYVCIWNVESKNGQGKRAVCTIFIIRGLAMGVGYVIGINDYERVYSLKLKYPSSYSFFGFFFVFCIKGRFIGTIGSKR